MLIPADDDEMAVCHGGVKIEVLAKLRRGGEQTVRVEHVHVHSGGQAVAGHVSRREPARN